MKDKLNITIRIADLAPMPLRIDIATEELNRSAEYNLNRLYGKWYEQYKGSKSSKEVLAMVAFQFAKLYLEKAQENENANEMLLNFEQELDKILLKVD